MKRLYAFDFDGTLTTKDTLLEFIKFAKGRRALYLTLVLYFPLLVLMKLRLYSNYRAKEKVFSHLFRGMSIKEFDSHCSFFMALNCRRLLRPKAVDYIYDKVLADDDAAMVVVSASIENWVVPFFDGMEKISVIGTVPEVKDGFLTGRFSTANCYGEEKVRRLLELYPDRDDYQLIAFGDSRGDRELLAIANEAHYKPFRL